MPRRSTPKRKQVCPALSIRHQERNGKIAIVAFAKGIAMGEDAPVGKMMLYESPGHLSVGYATVDPELQRCGIGTRLYEHAVGIACDYEKPLASDDMRTLHSESFWQKQVKRGRARCVRRPDPELEIGVKLDDEWNKRGMWDCGQYALNEACPADASLAGGLGGSKKRAGGETTRQEIVRKVSYGMANDGLTFGEALQTYAHGGKLTEAEQVWVEALEDRSMPAWRRFRGDVERRAEEWRQLIARTGGKPKDLKGVPRPLFWLPPEVFRR